MSGQYVIVWKFHTGEFRVTGPLSAAGVTVWLEENGDDWAAVYPLSSVLGLQSVAIHAEFTVEPNA